MAFKPKINQVGEDPYLLKLSKLHKPMPTRSPYSVEQLCLLARQEPKVRSSKNFREKVEHLSLKSLPLSFFPFLSLKILSFPPLKRLGQVGGRVLLLPHVSLQLTHRITPYPLYPSTLDFHPIRRCHMSTWAPLSSHGLTNSAPDTWHTASHSNCAKCPALPSLPRKT